MTSIPVQPSKVQAPPLREETLPRERLLEWLAVKKGVTGITPRIESGGQNMNTWNMHLWDKA